MLLGVYLKNKALSADPGFLKMKSKLEGAGAVMYEIDSNDNLQDGTDAVLSVGGDGTFLSASQLVADSGVPILGEPSARCRKCPVERRLRAGKPDHAFGLGLWRRTPP